MKSSPPPSRSILRFSERQTHRLVSVSASVRLTIDTRLLSTFLAGIFHYARSIANERVSPMPGVAPASLRRILSAGAFGWWRSAGLDTVMCCCEAMLTSPAALRRKKSATAPTADQPAERCCFIINCPWRCGLLYYCCTCAAEWRGGRWVRHGVPLSNSCSKLFRTVRTCLMLTDNIWQRPGVMGGGFYIWEWPDWSSGRQKFAIVVWLPYKCLMPYKWYLSVNVCCTRL